MTDDSLCTGDYQNTFQWYGLPWVPGALYSSKGGPLGPGQLEKFSAANAGQNGRKLEFGSPDRICWQNVPAAGWEETALQTQWTTWEGFWRPNLAISGHRSGTMQLGVERWQTQP